MFCNSPFVAKKILGFALAAAFLGSLTPLIGSAQATASPGVQKAATDVYVYGYPLVTMELTRRSFTNVAAASPTNAPMGQFANMVAYPGGGRPSGHGARTPTRSTRRRGST